MTNLPTSPDAIPTSLTAAAVIATVVLAGAIVYLFKYYSTKLSKIEDERRADEKERSATEKAYSAERASWLLERQKLEHRLDEAHSDSRSEFDREQVKILERHAAVIRSMAEDAREQEATARREYAANMEIVASKAAEAHQKIGTVLDKLLDRLVGSRRPI